MQDAEKDPNKDDASALIFEVCIIAGVSNPIHKPYQDDKANPVDNIEADAICHSKRPDSLIGGQVNEREVVPICLSLNEATYAIGRLLYRKDCVYAGEHHR